MQRWEYARLWWEHEDLGFRFASEGEEELDLTGVQHPLAMNLIGKLGWELAGIDTPVEGEPSMFHFKRPL